MLRATPFILRKPIVQPSLFNVLREHRRLVATSVSGRPASQTFEHAALNIKEEAGNSASDLAKMIAGTASMENAMAADASFASITKSIASEVPKPYLYFGLAGALPYLGASASTVYFARQAGLAAAGEYVGMDPGVAITMLDQALSVQMTYGAVLLSFLGAMHWGMEFAGYGGRKMYSRLALGAAPVLFAWPTLALQPMTALVLQWAGFTGLWWADAKATREGWAPKWYAQYRFYLSILVGTCIIGSLAGTSYYGPVGGHGFLSHDLDMLREMRKEHMPERTGVIGGPIEAVSTGEKGDFYVAIKKKSTESGDASKGEGAEKGEKEVEDKRQEEANQSASGEGSSDKENK